MHCHLANADVSCVIRAVLLTDNGTPRMTTSRTRVGPARVHRGFGPVWRRHIEWSISNKSGPLIFCKVSDVRHKVVCRIHPMRIDNPTVGAVAKAH
jgi:hypothetical protein